MKLAEGMSTSAMLKAIGDPKAIAEQNITRDQEAMTEQIHGRYS